MPAAHDIYADQLRDLRRGLPLYHPEPRAEGPVEIGDVGFTKDGAFRRLFNVSRPAGDPIQRFGVPDDFIQLDLGAIDKFDADLEPGPLHSRTISTISTEIETPGEILPAEASFHFNCSSKRGAILMLEMQMDRTEVIQFRRVEAYVMQHCRSWHAFARNLEFRIGFGDIMLVTECSKTAAWSSAVYSNSSTEFGLSFSVGMPFTTVGIAASRSLEKIGPVERRRSQKRGHDQDLPMSRNHTVFIKAYRVGMRQMYYRSLVYLFMRARGPNLNLDERSSRPQVEQQLPSTSSQELSSLSSAGPFIIGLHGSDFHASLALLALELEKSDDAECVILHDKVWCSANPDSNDYRIMDEYTDFYFSDEVIDHLNSGYGGIPYNTDLPSGHMSKHFRQISHVSKVSNHHEGTTSKTLSEDTDFDGTQTSSGSGLLLPVEIRPMKPSFHPALASGTISEIIIDLTDKNTFLPLTHIFKDEATVPPTHSLSVVCRHLPWKMVISPSSREPGATVTVSDVFHGLYYALQSPVTAEEFKTEPSQMQASIAQAFEARCRNSGTVDKREALRLGIKRIDFLLKKNRLLGFTLDDGDYSAEHVWTFTVST